MLKANVGRGKEKTVSEGWLYPITLRAIAEHHALNLVPLMAFSARIALPAGTPSGTDSIQIDVVAADTAHRTLVLAECKDFLTHQGASMCAEQLILNTYLLKTYLLGPLGDRQHRVEASALTDYTLIRYVSLGGHPPPDYANARTTSDDETRQRLDMYVRYMNRIGRCGLGVVLFRDKDSMPIVKPATPCKWTEAM